MLGSKKTPFLNRANEKYKNDVVFLECIKAVLILFTAVFWLASLSLIWMGIWLQTDFEHYLKISENYSLAVPYVLIIIGTIALLITSVSCFCLVRIKPEILLINGCIQIVMIFVLVCLSVYIYGYKDQVIAGVDNGLKHEIKIYTNYNPPSNLTTPLIDHIQESLYCCGGDGILDWPDQTVPISCYTNKFELTANQVKSDVKNIYKAGCAPKLKSSIERNLSAIGVIVCAIALFPLFGGLLSFALTTKGPSVGYEPI